MDSTAFIFFGSAFILILVIVGLEVLIKKLRPAHRPLDQQNRNRSMLFSEDHLKESSVTECSSPDCIRCSRNLTILQKALTRLSYFSDESLQHQHKVTSDNDGMTRETADCSSLSLIISDIKKSIEKIKRRSQNLDMNLVENTDSLDIYELTESKEKAESQICLKSSDVLQHSSSPLVFQMSGLREIEFWHRSNFPALQILDQYFKQIVLEFVHLYKSPLIETRRMWKTNHTSQGKWEIAQIIDQGRKTKSAEFCPITMEALNKITCFMKDNYFGDASFSVVHPGTTIATHCGSTNCRIRCHLGLQVPDGECVLQVGDKTHQWKEGTVLCFNDAFPHSVRHEGDESSEVRAVFLLDLWHPDITDNQKEMINCAFHP